MHHHDSLEFVLHLILDTTQQTMTYINKVSLNLVLAMIPANILLFFLNPNKLFNIFDISKGAYSVL